jgi:hypothetical protein
MRRVHRRPHTLSGSGLPGGETAVYDVVLPMLSLSQVDPFLLRKKLFIDI